MIIAIRNVCTEKVTCLADFNSFFPAPEYCFLIQEHPDYYLVVRKAYKGFIEEYCSKNHYSPIFFREEGVVDGL